MKEGWGCAALSRSVMVMEGRWYARGSVVGSAMVCSSRVCGSVRKRKSADK